MRDFSPIINRLRTGSAIDPYVEKVEYLTVKNSILFLAELPSKFDGVIISGYSEVSEDTLQTIGLLDADQYVVDYKNGSIYFNASENDKQVTIAYKGRGIAMTPADRIYYSEGGVIQSLQDIIEEAVDKTTEASSAIAYAKAQGDYAKAQGALANDKATLADQKATLASTAASNADTKGAYAKEQGDFAKAQGENAQAKASEAISATNQAITAKNDAVTATTNANQATQNANDKASFAQTQGNYAKQEGDVTKQATSDFQTVKASVLQAKTDTEEATQIALDSAENADTKAALADTKATLANDKATLADQKATLAQEKADLANASATNADTKANLADSKATLADEKAALAQSKAEYAQTQGEYAKSQGDIARNESSNLSIMKTDVTNATTLANSKAQEADTQAQYAKTQGDYAKEQGDLAREALDAGGVSTVNGKSGVVTLTPTDIGTMSTADINAAVNFAKSEVETYADEKISEVIGSAPETLDTLNELAQALGDDPNFATTVSNQIGLKADQLAFDLHKNDGSIHPTTAKQAEWDNKIPKTEKGAPSGVATLDPSGKVPSTQLPPIASSWDTLTGKPSLFPSTAHTHAVSDVVGLQDALSNAVKMASYPYLITAAANQSSFVVPVETFDKVNDLLVVVINGRHLATDDYSVVDKTVTFTEQLSAGDSIYGYVLKNVPKSIAEGYSGANLADGTVAKSKLSSEIVTSLNKADSAIQSLPAASTTVSGTVILDDTANSNSTTKAATANSVKGVSDRVTANADQIGILSDNAVPYGTASGADTKTITITNAFTTLKTGLALSFKNTTANTTAVTLNVNGLGAKPIVKSGGTALSSGNLKAGGVYTVRYDGTSFILQGEGGEYGVAQPSDVREGTTFGTENGLRTGTMPSITFAVGVFALYENTAFKSSESTSSSNPKKVYDLDMTFPGTYRVSFNINSGGYTGYGQIYKNGIPIGIQRSTTNSTGVEFTEDFTVNAGDNIQLYSWNSNSTASTTVKLFRIAVQPLFTIVV